MTDSRILKHPILTPKPGRSITFMFNGRPLKAKENEVISSALFAHGIHTFKNHQRDGAPQGIYCANGQCGQCLVLSDGVPVKACITPVKEGMDVRSIDGIPELPEDDSPVQPSDIKVMDTDILIVGAGPSGLSAAVELAAANLDILIVDDKQDIGGKLSLQTHNFFGSIRECYAGFRGLDIAQILLENVKLNGNVKIWLSSPVVGVFSDKLVGIVKEGVYKLVRPKYLLVTSGAREKTLAFEGCDLPGVYGAGAFQTLVNRDMVKPSQNLFIIGAGNVGLIAAYHAVQAGINVIGLAEALPFAGGYKVHLDKILRLGISVYLSHSVVKAEGKDHIESVIISEVDRNFKPVSGTEKRYFVDTLLIAVGLSPVNELVEKARDFGLNVKSAGDAEVIAEASAAMFSGKIRAREILNELGYSVDIPKEWYEMLDILRAKPGDIKEKKEIAPEGMMIYPILRCSQEIPCNPCSEVCPQKSMSMPTGNINELPDFNYQCIGCGRCVSICPGLAITLVDHSYDPAGNVALVSVPWEMPSGSVRPGTEVATSGFEGNRIGTGRVIAIKSSKWQNQRSLVALEVPKDDADHVAGIRLFDMVDGVEAADIKIHDDDIIVCRCERVTKKEIRERIRAGARDFNALKAATRVCMGECGGKTCTQLIWQIFREEGMDLKNITAHTQRPFVQEVTLSDLLGGDPP
jgi:NADPH-dependent 2,4-dienoyl-CoA reductase/sulfur reductase-like enzyme/Fe-S-cluster-containing hydrogenase component 2/bacterioferritin-associated ferredoxin